MKSASLHIILDVSGSMQEMGKLMLARNLISCIREKCCLKSGEIPFKKMQFFIWNDKVCPVDLSNDNETPHFKASGKVDMDQLIELLGREASAGLLQNVIILSDGNFSKNTLKKFCVWRKEQSNVNIRTVAIGADASHFNLKEMATNNHVILSENISTVIQSFYYGIDSNVLPPYSIGELTLPSDTEDEEDYD